MLEKLQNRRSVRQYTGESIPKEKLDQVIQAGLLSASSRAIRPWEFVVVQNADTLQKLAGCRMMGSAMLAGASAAILVFGDTSASDVWIEDCSIAMANMHLMADSLGLGSCWIQGRLRQQSEGVSTSDFVSELVGAPENMELEAILSIGTIETHPARIELEDLKYEKVHYENF